MKPFNSQHYAGLHLPLTQHLYDIDTNRSTSQISLSPSAPYNSTKAPICQTPQLGSWHRADKPHLKQR